VAEALQLEVNPLVNDLRGYSASSSALQAGKVLNNLY
jgi:hypothetical protein